MGWRPGPSVPGHIGPDRELLALRLRASGAMIIFVIHR